MIEHDAKRSGRYPWGEEKQTKRPINKIIDDLIETAKESGKQELVKECEYLNERIDLLALLTGATSSDELWMVHQIKNSFETEIDFPLREEDEETVIATDEVYDLVDDFSIWFQEQWLKDK